MSAIIALLLSQVWAAEHSVSRLPRSNQAEFDEPTSYLYLGYTASALTDSVLRFGRYTSDFRTSSLGMLALDSFTRVTSSRFFSVWGRYGIIGAFGSGRLDDPRVALSEASRGSNLLVLGARLGFTAQFDGVGWVRPYLAATLSPFWFRHGAPVAGAEADGIGALGGPAAGLHFPSLFRTSLSLFAEVRQDLAIRTAGVLDAGTEWGAGLGMVF